jgi:outer membrane protein assembly factor BamA
MRAIIHVDQGNQYRVAGVTVVNEDPAHALLIPEEQLRQQVDLAPGDVFDINKLKMAFEGTRQLYVAQGYADMTPNPDIVFDDKSHVVSLKIYVQEGNQYHVKSFEVLGLDSGTTQLLEARMPSGSIFNFTLLRELFDQGKAVVGPNVTFENVAHITRNMKAATVDISLDFSGDAARVN